ncbi:MAG: winged helix-turn-helix domain-containing protein [Thermoleophilia bacterium]
MVVDLSSNDPSADRVFHALADATRRDILMRLGAHPGQSVSGLARAYPISVTAVQKHVGVLEAAGLVVRHRRGREQLVHPDPDGLETLRALMRGMEAVWRSRMERFEEALDDPSEGATQ